MNDDRAWLYLAAGAAALVAVFTPGSAPPFRLQSGQKILLLGDGFARALGLPLSSIARQQQVQVVVDARPSATIDTWLSSVSSLGAADVVVVSLGAQEARGQMVGFAEKAKKLVDALSARGARVVWALPPSLPWDTAGMCAAVQGTGVQTFDPRRVDIQRGPDNASPTVGGAARWAALLWQSLR